jgi:hypothetical protein
LKWQKKLLPIATMRLKKEMAQQWRWREIPVATTKMKS